MTVRMIRCYFNDFALKTTENNIVFIRNAIQDYELQHYLSNISYYLLYGHHIICTINILAVISHIYRLFFDIVLLA